MNSTLIFLAFFVISHSAIAREVGTGLEQRTSLPESAAWSKIGSCQADTGKGALKKKWEEHHAELVERINANAKTISTNARFLPTTSITGEPQTSAPLEIIKDVLQNPERSDSKALFEHFKSSGITLEKLAEWELNPPLAKDVPYPPATLIDEHSKSYRDSVGEVLNTYLETFGPEIKHPAPAEENAFDDNIAGMYLENDKATVSVGGIQQEIGKKELEAIDGVARTIWAESLNCASSGLPQFEAVAKIIADRSLSVCKPSRAGMRDFGRKDKANSMHCAAQVISKDKQFSNWTSHRRQLKSLSQLGVETHPNIPNVKVTIRSPQGIGSGDYYGSLARTLCPEPSDPKSEIGRSAKMKELWDKAVSLAKDVVLRPQYFSDTFQWDPPQKGIYFYTHGPPMRAKVRELRAVTGIRVPTSEGSEVKPKRLRGTNRSTCQQLRLFQPTAHRSY